MTRTSGITNRAAPDTVIDAATPSPSPTPKDIQTLLSTLDAQLKQLYESLPARTALVIFTGHSDPRRMAELNARKSAFESAIRAGRTPER